VEGFGDKDPNECWKIADRDFQDNLIEKKHYLTINKRRIVMTTETLQQKIEERAKKRVDNEYKKFVNFMQSNELCKLLKFKEGETLVPFCGHYYSKPLFETGIQNKMENADNYTNFNEAKKQLFELFVKEETNELLRKIDSLSDYFEEQSQQLP